MILTKQSLALALHCPLVAQQVELTIVQMVHPDGATELLHKSCARFADCYGDRVGDPVTGNIVPDAGCLLGKDGI